MADRRRNLVLGLLMLMLFCTLPCGTQAAALSEPNDNVASLSMIYANYLDLDNDGLSDDILTESLLLVPERLDVWLTVELTTLTLPSGMTFDSVVIVTQDYTGLQVTIAWYNTAIESGWYEVSVLAVVVGQSGTVLLQTEILFDPPGGGDPGPPLVDVTNTTIIP